MNTLHLNQNQLNNQIPYSSPERGEPITPAEKASVIVAMQTVAGDTGGFDWYSSRVVAGNCPFCGSSDTGTTEHGTRICYSCGKVWR